MTFHFLSVAIGGFFGSMLRFFIATKLNKHVIGTWVTNITGSVLVAFLLKNYLQGMLAERFWLMLGVGFCGAYTTFSTFGSETIQLIEAKKYRSAFFYVLCSFTVSLSLVGLILAW